MNDVSKGEGRTVLFVSHNMGAIQTLCTNTLILKNGALLLQGKTEMVIREYFTQNSSNIRKVVCEQSNKKIWFKTIFVTNKAGLSKTEFLHDDPIYIKYQLGYNIEKTTHDYTIFCIILDQNKKRIFSAESGIVKNDEYALIINPNTLVRGAYSIHTFIHKPRTEQIDVAEDVCEFQVIDNGSWLNIHGEYDYGVVFGNSTWVDIQYIAK